VEASEITGLPDVLDGGRAGLLVSPGDVRGLRAALDRLLDDAVLRARLGAAAREHALREHDARRQTDRLVAYLRAAARWRMI
jgi:glycosyltransferase involved in cell wall biosynthesis